MIRLLLLLTITLKVAATAWVADDITGLWYNQEKDAKIRITGANGKYFGRIEWLKIPNDPETGKPKLDKHNPKTEKRTRPVMGLAILANLVFDSEEQEWSKGQVYDPKSGNTYSLTCSLKDKNTMELRGFIGFSLLGRTDTWTRAEEETK
jgi:uncharacterized protein (DUF2147 family)